LLVTKDMEGLFSHRVGLHVELGQGWEIRVVD